MAEAPDSDSGGWGFESLDGYVVGRKANSANALRVAPADAAGSRPRYLPDAPTAPGESTQWDWAPLRTRLVRQRMGVGTSVLRSILGRLSHPAVGAGLNPVGTRRRVRRSTLQSSAEEGEPGRAWDRLLADSTTEVVGLRVLRPPLGKMNSAGLGTGWKPVGAFGLGVRVPRLPLRPGSAIGRRRRPQKAYSAGSNPARGTEY